MNHKANISDMWLPQLIQLYQLRQKVPSTLHVGNQGRSQAVGLGSPNGNVASICEEPNNEQVSDF